MTRQPHHIPSAYDFHGHKVSGCFGDALIEVLRFTPAEIEEDIRRAGAQGIEIGTTSERVETAVAAKDKQDTAVRLHTKRRREARARDQAR